MGAVIVRLGHPPSRRRLLLLFVIMESVGSLTRRLKRIVPPSVRRHRRRAVAAAAREVAKPPRDRTRRESRGSRRRRGRAGASWRARSSGYTLSLPAETQASGEVSALARRVESRTRPPRATNSRSANVTSEASAFSSSWSDRAAAAGCSSALCAELRVPRARPAGSAHDVWSGRGCTRASADALRRPVTLAGARAGARIGDALLFYVAFGDGVAQHRGAGGALTGAARRRRRLLPETPRVAQLLEAAARAATLGTALLAPRRGSTERSARSSAPGLRIEVERASTPQSQPAERGAQRVDGQARRDHVARDDWRYYHFTLPERRVDGRTSRVSVLDDGR